MRNFKAIGVTFDVTELSRDKKLRTYTLGCPRKKNYFV